MMSVIKEVCKSFNLHAKEYEQSAKIQKEIGQRMFSRLSYFKIAPQRALDLGCGVGNFSLQLKKLYPKADVVGLDIAHEMLNEAKRKQGWRKKWPLINASMDSLPFEDGSFELIFANQVIHWTSDIPKLFSELNRVLAPEGCLMFSTLGPDTFKELKQAWSSVDDYQHVNSFVDMHDLGDWLLQQYFVDPVVDMESLTVEYELLSNLVKALKSQGVKNIHGDRRKGLTTKSSWQKFTDNYTQIKGGNPYYPLSYEVVYGHAWKGDKRKTDKGHEAIIPISKISKR